MTDHLSAIFLQQLCDQENEPRAIVKAESPRFEMVAYNNYFVQISRTEGQELAGKSMAELQSWNNINEEGAIQIYDALISTIHTKTTVSLPVVRYDLAMPDGTLVPSWWQAVYEPLLNAQGDVKYILCMVHNGTAASENENLNHTEATQPLS